ncbi:Uma2 family endonuclease [Candidatus Parabeggiatoa sp. HSG14]|uniref:Uma2 family endonuclease n=1 Tax=Candidatus Parabeggiatoa sp. HSG14 TaxID=3055593 RepID=UPI0025A8E1A6|nr:Uma2 family endonuclease [Thiotrichales bacterium HSG14]
MSTLSTIAPLKARQEVFIRTDSGFKAPEMRLDSPHPVTRTKPKQVTETEYWENYYDDPEIIYEWNNGILEEKGVSDLDTTAMYGWLFELVGHYLNTHPVGRRIFLETGFRMPLPHKTVIRRPDLGVILDKDAVPYQPTDNSYRGICHLCVEAISDSKKKYITQDTSVKFEEYQTAGVQEYFILYSKDIYLEFYCLNEQGLYSPIKRIKGDVIQSTVLPGFQFRISDLFAQPLPKKMAFDPIYEKFVMPYYQEERLRAEAEQRLRQIAEAKAKEETQRVEAEQKLRQIAEAKAKEKTQRVEAEQKLRQIAEAKAKEETQRADIAETKAKEAEDRIRYLEAEFTRFRKS